MPRKLKISPDELRYYILQNAGKKTLYAMSIELEIQQGTISNYASDMGVSLHVVEKIEKREKLREMIRDHGHEFTAKEVSDTLEIPVNTVRYNAWQMGIVLKRDAANPVHLPKLNGNYFNPHMHENWLV